MPCIKFDSAVQRHIPLEGPTPKPLRRRESAPELADMRTMHDNTQQTYDVGNTVRLQLHGHSIQTKIVKVFRPFTMAQAMVVRVLEPTLDLEGVYVLKMYDRRYFEAVRTLRDDTSEVWSTFKDLEFEKRRFEKSFGLFYYGDDYWSDDNDSVDLSEDLMTAECAAYGELRYEVDCLKRYRAEVEVYRRMREQAIDGMDVPRFIGIVRIPRSYTSKFCRTENSGIDGAPGILMQYVPGFSMIELYDTPSPPPRREDWTTIIDDGLRTVRYWMQNMDICNVDDGIARNSVVHWDAIGEKWKCKLIDFGNCVFRKEGKRKWNWRDKQALMSEESKLGWWMVHHLEEKKGFKYEWELSQYTRELVRDFLGEHSTGIEPDDGYESQSSKDEKFSSDGDESQSSQSSHSSEDEKLRSGGYVSKSWDDEK